ncbi:hypothetical protein L0Y46_02075 [bacterium]|nr:hypothetical protein [bacterium]MCI0680215.1 hypothetical protein [bacterium]
MVSFNLPKVYKLDFPDFIFTICGGKEKGLCCSNEEIGTAAWRHLKKRVPELRAIGKKASRIKIAADEAACLGRCQRGPVLRVTDIRKRINREYCLESHTVSDAEKEIDAIIKRHVPDAVFLKNS